MAATGAGTVAPADGVVAPGVCGALGSTGASGPAAAEPACGMISRRPSTSCDSEVSRTLVSSSFSRSTRRSPPTPSVNSF